MRKRDSQKSAVYAWESKAMRLYAKLLKRSYSQQEGRELLSLIWREQATRCGRLVRNPPSLRFRACSGSSFYHHNKHEIAISEGHPELWVLLHEIAHALNGGRDLKTEAGHGPRFVAIYIMLLAIYGGADSAQMRESAAEMGVRVLDRFHVEAKPSATIIHYLPDTMMGLAVSMGKSYREIQGALIGPLKRGEVIRRGKMYRAAA